MRSINIRTSQNVIINYDLAPLRDRFTALFIDIIVILLTFLLIVLIVTKFKFDEDGAFVAMLPYLTLILFFAYGLGMEIFNNGQTLGKMAIGIRVLKLDGSEPSLSDFVIRSIFHLIDTYFCLGVLGAIFIATSENGQRMGDRAANTVVVKLNVYGTFNLKDILNISTTEDYEPVYIDVKNIGEEDMLVVKNAIIRYRDNPNASNAQVLNKLSAKLIRLLDIREKPKNNLEFLKTVIKDYIVSTR